MKTGEKVIIHYHDIDGIGYGDSINTEGTIIREERDGTILVEYKDEHSFYKKQKEFYPYDLTLTE